MQCSVKRCSMIIVQESDSSSGHKNSVEVYS